MLGLGVAIGALIFIAGLILVGLSGARGRSGTWVGPAGTALTTIGLVVQITSVIGR